jgi:hypothetical protein
MATAKRKKKPAPERGYMPIDEVAASLRALASQLIQDNKGRLAKVSLNIWYEEDDEAESLTELQRAMIDHDNDMQRLDRNTQGAVGGSSE